MKEIPMTAEEQVTQVLYRAIDLVNAARPPQRRLAKSLSAPLIGEGAVLDSLGMVNLIVAVEEAVADACGVTINLADEKARARQPSPFRTVGALAAYVQELVTTETQKSTETT